ncbi:cation diffusion facilitator family transporter [Tengunoibacter tsumagoiensis]|uniref:Cadmium, cobalt and zinc/H(+)-K(+) antiporter n=1 Tax=Tengunoibacter tsumagoiensis TaxID=2014871 RepID=A0A401ZYL1_9CHLR|nr:cation diffusion facilitator family transporter [Tengunoibacter tsumagoiensis]GCE11920.1 cadmium, cobalt and zinc/H(+)-K(+) antiporter [Tengunoibacter tsumagoiensis]
MTHTHAGHSHHDHTSGMAKKSLRLAFFLTMIILLAGCIGGFFAHSLALLSDASHTLTDLFALGLAWFAAVQAERPSNEGKTFGYHRVGILAALLNAFSLIVIALFIIWEAIQRFQHPEPVNPFIMFGSALVAIVINLFIGFGLRKENHNLNVRAASLHVFGDVAASVGVIVAGGLIVLTGWSIIDPILSVAIALVVAFGAWHILRETIDILLEATPRGISLTDLVADMKAVEGVEDVHDLHVWSITSGMPALSSHVQIANLPFSASSSILNALRSMLTEKYHIHHATIQFECPSEGPCCTVESLYCSFKGSVQAKHVHVCDEEHEHASQVI